MKKWSLIVIQKLKTANQGKTDFEIKVIANSTTIFIHIICQQQKNMIPLNLSTTVRPNIANFKLLYYYIILKRWEAVISYTKPN